MEAAAFSPDPGVGSVDAIVTAAYNEISELIERINKIGSRIGHVVQNIDKSFAPRNQ